MDNNRYKEVNRFEDMSHDGKLKLIKQFDGDMILVIYPPTEHEGLHYMERDLPVSVEFCTQGGGGTSPRTLQALYKLFDAMQEDCNDNLDLQADRNHIKTK